MRRVAGRLDALERVIGPGPEPSADPPAFVRWWSHPVAFGVLCRFCTDRAHRRFIAAGGDRSGWSQVPEEERDERTGREWGGMRRWCDDLGGEAGVAAWHQEAEGWPDPYGHRVLNQESLDRQLRHEWDLADSYRAWSPLFRRTWPEWHPGMTDGERLAFDVLLMDERDARLASLLASPPTPVAARPNRGRQRQ
jgi:hypothetical protein